MTISPYRPTHEITPYHPTVLDIETAPSGDVIGIGFAYEDETGEIHYSQYDEWAEFWEAYLKIVRRYKRDKIMKKRVTRVYAHNGANFDWLTLIDWLHNNHMLEDLKVVMSSSIAIGMRVKISALDATIDLRDSMRLLPAGLDALTKQFGANHLKLDTADYKSDMLRFKTERPTEFWAYLQHDVLGLQEVLYKFWVMIVELEGNIGDLPMTLPALSLRLFRLHLKQPIITPWNKAVKEFTRRAYRGGRVECYRPGDYEHVTAFDVNSMYPYVMRDFPVPSSYRGAWTTDYQPDRLGIYEIKFNQKVTWMPPILYDEAKNDLSYSGQTVCTSVDIETFRPYGTFEVIRGYFFAETAYLFTDFVNRYYGLRRQAQEEGNHALAYTCKILLNSLYGKFGQRPESTKIVLATPEIISNTEHKVIAQPGSDYALLVEDAAVEHEFVAVAAFITAYARRVLYQYIEQAPDAYIYCDTDSIHTTKPEIYPTGTGLGELKIEYAGPASYVGRKLYAQHGINKIRAKGISVKSATVPFTAEDMRRLARGDVDSITVEFTRFPTGREVLIGGKAAAKTVKRTRTINRLSGALPHSQPPAPLKPLHPADNQR